VIAARMGTPMPYTPADLPQIAPASAQHLTLLAQWGLGLPQSVAWSPDGNWIAVGSSRGVALLDSQTLQVTRRAEGNFTARAVAFSPDTALLAAACQDGHVRLWSFEDDFEEIPLDGLPSQASFFSVAFTHSQPVLLAGGNHAGELHIWDAASGDRQDVISTAAGDLRDIAFTPDGAGISSWSPAGNYHTWALSSGRKELEIYTYPATGGSAAAFSSDGDYLAISGGRRFKVLRAANGTILTALESLTKDILNLAISPEAQYLAVLHSDEVVVYTLADRQPLRRYPLVDESARSVTLAFSPDGSRLVVAGRSLQIFDVDEETTQPQRSSARVFGGGYPVQAAFDGQDTLLIADRSGGRIERYVLPDGEPAGSLILSELPIDHLALSGQAASWTIFSLYARLGVFDVNGEQAMTNLSTSRVVARPLGISASGKLAAAMIGERLRIWDVASGAELANFVPDHRPAELIFSPDETLLAGVSAGGVQLWNAASGETADDLEGARLAFSPAEDRVALLQRDGPGWRIQIQSAQGSGEAISLPGVGSRMAFDPSGALLAVSGADLVVFDAFSGETLFSLTSPAPHGQVLFSPDGRLLALVGWDGVTWLYGVVDG